MDSQTLVPAPASNLTQTITFTEDEEYGAIPIIAQDVTINCSTGNHNCGSSEVKLSNVIDFNWELKYYSGNKIAVHVAGLYFAYTIKIKECGMVRVSHKNTDYRALLKDIGGEIQDISFAHMMDEVLLACVNDKGTIIVYKCEQIPNDTKYTFHCIVQLHVTQHDDHICNDFHRVVWCPYLPDEDDSEMDMARLVAITHGNTARLFKVYTVNSLHGAGPISTEDLAEGYLTIAAHSKPIMDVAFSPDGTALATASVDGFVKFFQIYMHGDRTARCLHEWQPHEGKPLSCLSFLDNHNFNNPEDKFWKFALTGCNNNTELKIWSCEVWACIQTIHFLPSPLSSSKNLVFKLSLDLSAGFLFLSEIYNRIFYCLEMHKETNGTKAFARSITELLVPSSFMSFHILRAETKKISCRACIDDPANPEEDEVFGDQQDVIAAVIHMMVITPKKLQDCEIMYSVEDPEKTVPLPALDTIPLYRNGMSDVATETLEEPIEKKQDATPTRDIIAEQLTELTNILQNNLPKEHINDLKLIPTQPLNLMTPDAFSSPAKNDNDITLSITPSLINMNSPCSEKKKGSTEETIPSSTMETDILGFQRPQKDFTSAGSSPSREVQEILSLNNSSYPSHEFYDDDKSDENNAVRMQKKGMYEQKGSNNTSASNLNADGWPIKPISADMKSEKIRPTQETSQNNLELQSLKQCFVSLENVIKEQNAQIEELRTEVQSLKSSQDKCNIPDDLENVIAKQLDLALARSHAQQTKLFDGWANARLNKDREHQENMAVNISHLVQKQLQTIISNEMKSTVIPKVINVFENLKIILQEDFTQKLDSTDQMMKESLSKFVSSKVVADSMSNAVVDVMRPGMEACYKDVIGNTLVPSWERVCTNMFQQIHETFTQGTKEYTASVENYMERQRRIQEKGRELVTLMQALSEVMRTCTEKLSTQVPKDLQLQLQSSFISLQDAMAAKLNEMIKDQIATAFKNHASMIEDSVMNAVRSRAVTPAPVDTQVQLAQIQQLLSQGHLNSAFQQALSASDLNLVMYICERVNPVQVFAQNPCPLMQPVLLSLIQQLSADMSKHTELKHKFLEEAVLNLDVKNPLTKEHLSLVLKSLSSQLTNFIVTNPTNKITRKMKMLQMATQSLMKN